MGERKNICGNNMAIWLSGHIYSILLYYYVFLPTKDILPTPRQAITAWVSRSFKNMRIRVNKDSLSVPHTTFPRSLNDAVITKQINLQRSATHETPVQPACLSCLDVPA